MAWGSIGIWGVAFKAAAGMGAVAAAGGAGTGGDIIKVLWLFWVEVVTVAVGLDDLTLLLLIDLNDSWFRRWLKLWFRF